jgi:hypothetical protein
LEAEVDASRTEHKRGKKLSAGQTVHWQPGIITVEIYNKNNCYQECFWDTQFYNKINLKARRKAIYKGF